MAKILQTPNRPPDVVKPRVVERCDCCRFYKKREGADGVGNCYRYPPEPDGRIPLTKAESFCGEFATK